MVDDDQVIQIGTVTEKIMLIGAIAAGKTSLVRCYTNLEINRAQPRTLNVDYSQKIVTLPRIGKIRARIADTAGIER